MEYRQSTLSTEAPFHVLIGVAQSIVGYPDLALGDRVEPVLEVLIRAGGGRLSGVRYSVGYDALAMCLLPYLPLLEEP